MWSGFRNAREKDLERELRSHLEAEAEEQSAAGLPPEEAHYAARRALGNTTAIQEGTREAWGWMSLERLWQDLRFARRMFLRNPGFVTIAAVSLALGIGGNAAMFSLVNALLIRPLPYADPARLVRITSVYPKAALPMFQQQSRTMEIASYSPASDFTLTAMGRTQRVAGSFVSDNLLQVLGAQVEMGRAFHAGEQRTGADQLVILSHAAWKTKFDSDPQIIGRIIAVDDVNRQIVGVMPAGFVFPSPKVQMWMPARMDPSNLDDYWGGDYLTFIGRLHPGATLAQARDDARALMARLRPLFPFPMPRNWNGDITVIPMQADLVSGIRGKLLVLFASVGIVLLIACTNISSLLLSRAATRRKEMALRTALGAGRSRIIHQLLTESVLLAAIGAALGVLLGAVALSIFKSVLPPDTPALAGIGMDWQIVAFVAGLAVATGLVFGLAPALSASQVDLADCMKTGTARAATTRWSRLRSSLVICEVAATVVLVVSAGLLLKSLYEMATVNPGFETAHILTMRISPDPALCRQRAGCIALYRRLREQVATISGVSDVALTNTLPLDGQISDLPYDVEGHPKSADFPAPMLWTGAITPDYFRMLHIPLLAGRGFTSSDAAKSSLVMIVTASTARRFWPDASPLGKHLKPTFDSSWRTIVGVVSDVRQFNLTGRVPEGISGSVYLPYPQAVQADHTLPPAMDLMVRTNAAPAAVSGQIREIVRELNPNLPLSEVTSLDDLVAGSTADFRSTILVFLSFAATALVLAAAGIYGLVANSVAQRTYEIGVRVAIGASRAGILRLILGQSLRLALLGIAAGALAAFAVTRFLATLLFGVTSTDPLTFTAVCALLLGVAVAASFVPAWRAANLDPLRSLRAE